MERENLNQLLKDVIKEAQELKIPVPNNIQQEITINPRPKKRFACCKKKEDKFYIEVSKFVLKCNEKRIREILAHEIIHTCPDYYNHKSKWKEYAEKMNRQYGYNIKRASSFEELGLECKSSQEEQDKIKYIIKCTQCGEEYPRQRFTCVMKKIDAYRCNCGGKLILIRKK